MDSRVQLLNSYFIFLNKFGLTGSEKEFNKLDGPNISEIVAFLKKRYNLLESEKNLKKIYLDIVSKNYEKSRPRKSIQSTLKKLIKNGYCLGLVTSSKKNFVLRLLKKYELTPFFKIMVFGDSVTHSKPDPEIYLKAMKKLTPSKIMVFEDSMNGFQSAKSAGLKCVRISNNEKFFNSINNLLTCQ